MLQHPKWSSPPGPTHCRQHTTVTEIKRIVLILEQCNLMHHT